LRGPSIYKTLKSLPGGKAKWLGAAGGVAIGTGINAGIGAGIGALIKRKKNK